MEFVPLLVAAALILALVNLYKQAVAGDWQKVGVQVVSWGVGIAVAFLLAESDWASSVLIGSGDAAVPLSTLNPFSVVLVGVALAAVANLGYDVLPGTGTPTPGSGSGDVGEDDDALNEPGELPDWAAKP